MDLNMCPECGYENHNQPSICPSCGFDLAEYRTKMLEQKAEEDRKERIQIEKKQIEDSYKKAVKEYNKGSYNEAMALFNALNGYKDSIELIQKCIEALYEQVLQSFENNKLLLAISKNPSKAFSDFAPIIKELKSVPNTVKSIKEIKKEFKKLSKYKTVNNHVELCDTAIKLLSDYKSYKKAQAVIDTYKSIPLLNKMLESSSRSYDDYKDLVKKARTDLSPAIQADSSSSNAPETSKESIKISGSSGEDAINTIIDSFKQLGDNEEYKQYIENCYIALSFFETDNIDVQYEKTVAEYMKSALLAKLASDSSREFSAYYELVVQAFKASKSSAVGGYSDILKIKEAFIKLNGYSHSKQYIANCDTAIQFLNHIVKVAKYEKAKKLYDSNSYAESLAIFKEISDYQDSSEYIEKISVHSEKISVHSEKTKKYKTLPNRIEAFFQAIALSSPLVIIIVFAIFAFSDKQAYGLQFAWGLYSVAAVIASCKLLSKRFGKSDWNVTSRASRVSSIVAAVLTIIILIILMIATA